MPVEPFFSIRRLRILVVILLLSNLVVGAVSVYFMERVDSYYTHLIDATVPTLQDLRRLNVELSRMQGVLQGLAQPGTRGRMDSLLDQEAKARAADEASLRELNGTNAGSGQLSPWLENLAQIDREYAEATDQYLALVKAGRLDDAEAFGNGPLKAHYANYLVAIEDFAQAASRQNSRLNAKGTALTRTQQTYLVGLAGWPIIVLVVIVVMAIPLFTLLLFWFQRAKLDEGP